MPVYSHYFPVFGIDRTPNTGRPRRDRKKIAARRKAARAQRRR